MTDSARRLAALAFAVALVVTACGSSSPSDNPVSSPESTEAVTANTDDTAGTLTTQATTDHRPRTYESLDELMDDLAAGGLPCTDQRPIRTGNELEDPFQLEAGSCIRDQLTLQLYETPSVARTAGELGVAKTWELLDRIDPGSAEPRHWVLGGNWVVLCIDEGESCPAVQEILGGTIEVYDGPTETAADAGPDEQVRELHAYLDGELLGCGPELRAGPTVYVDATQGFAHCLTTLFEGLAAAGAGTPAQIEEDGERINTWLFSAVLEVAGTDDVAEARGCVGADDQLLLTVSVSADFDWYEITPSNGRSCD